MQSAADLVAVALRIYLTANPDSTRDIINMPSGARLALVEIWISQPVNQRNHPLLAQTMHEIIDYRDVSFNEDPTGDWWDRIVAEGTNLPNLVNPSADFARLQPQFFEERQRRGEAGTYPNPPVPPPFWTHPDLHT